MTLNGYINMASHRRSCQSHSLSAPPNRFPPRDPPPVQVETRFFLPTAIDTRRGLIILTHAFCGI